MKDTIRQAELIKYTAIEYLSRAQTGDRERQELENNFRFL